MPPQIDKHIISFYPEKVYQSGFNIEQPAVAHTVFPHFIEIHRPNKNAIIGSTRPAPYFPPLIKISADIQFLQSLTLQK